VIFKILTSNGGEGEVAQIMYTHVSKCKNNKKEKKKHNFQYKQEESENRLEKKKKASI
jgi:hypothetical protein